MQVPDINVVRRHSQAGDGNIVGPVRQTRLQARVAAVNFARTTLNNIKVHPVSDAILAQQNQDLGPSTVAQAMRWSDWSKWKDAMDAELESFYSLNVWEYAKLPPKAYLIKCKWIFVRKYDANGMLKKYKAQLVGEGFSQQEGVDYHGTFAPTVTLNAVRVLMAITNDRYLHLHSVDVKTALCTIGGGMLPGYTSWCYSREGCGLCSIEERCI